MQIKPSFEIENELISNNYDLVFGMDEVGRGSFAGPLVAAAVSFDKELQFDWFKEINDSKLLSKAKREELSTLILKNAICFIEEIAVPQIDKWGIGHCNKLIFEKLIESIFINRAAVKAFGDARHKSKIFFLIDGRETFKKEDTEFIIKGDQKSISIAAASIIAKVYRDNLMKEYHDKYPKYNFLDNKGYGTKAHREVIAEKGLCELHRLSFKIH